MRKIKARGQPINRVLATVFGAAIFCLWCGSLWARSSAFPKILFDGYLEGKYSFKQSAPVANRGVIEKDSVYQSLPSDLLEGSGKYEHTLKLRIDAKLDEKLSAAYDIEQQPDFPAKYDIQVIYDKTKLSFFNYNADIIGTTYTNASKALNGVYVQHDGDEWDVQAAYGRERSEPKKTTFSGTGETSYKIGQSSILEGSVQVIINDKPVASSEYEIDYYQGIIKFKTAKTSADQIKIIYEFTNPAEDFIPVLSHKNFLLTRIQYTNQAPVQVKPVEGGKTRELLLEPPPPPELPPSPAQLHPQLRPRSEGWNEFLPSWAPRLPDEFPQIAPLPGLAYTVNLDLPFTGERVWLDRPLQNRQEELEWCLSEIQINVDDYVSDSQAFGMGPQSIAATQSFQLERYPVVPGSETVYLSNLPLRPGTDYLIRYRSGTVSFPQLQMFPSDTLWINYKYYETVSTTEVIEAKDTQGPYYLAQSPVVRGSEVVDVDDNIYFRDVDYTVDYDNGRFMFTLPVQKPKRMKMTYTYFVLQETPSAESAAVRARAQGKTPLRFGVSYLNESARPDEDSLITARSGETPVISENMLVLAFSPVNASANFSIYDSGTTGLDVISADTYSLDTYLGVVTLTENFSSSGTENLRVDYSYNDSFATEVRFVPDGRTAYYTASDILYTQLPMKFHSEEIKILGGEFSSWTRLTREEEYEIDYGSDGNSPQIRFIRYDANHLASDLHNIVDQSYQIKVKYYFTPQQSPDLGQINHNVAGVDGEIFLDNGLRMGGEFAFSQNNVSRPKTSATVTMNGTGEANASYSLSNTNLVEDSEEVFLNNKLQSKNTDYIISYLSGTLRFRNLTPSGDDLILVNYEYLGGTLAQAGQDVVDTAWRMNGDYTLGDLEIHGRVETVGLNFKPMGAIPESQGTALWALGSTYQLGPSSDISFTFDQRRIKSGTRSDDSPQFSQTDQGNVLFKTAPFDGTQLRYQYQFQSSIVDDSNATVTTPSAESFGDSHLGEFSYQNSVLGTVLSAKSTQTRSHLSGANVINNQLSLSSSYHPEQFFFISTFSGEASIGTARAMDIGANTDTVATHYGIKSELSPMEKLSGSLETNAQINEAKDLAGNLSSRSQSNSNYYRMNYAPFNFLKANLDHRRNGSLSSLSGQAENVENLSNYRLERFSLYEAVYAVEDSDPSANRLLSWLLTPVKDAGMAYTLSTAETFKDDNFDRYHYNNSSLSVGGFAPIPILQTDSFKYARSNSLSEKLRESESASASIADNALSSWTGGLSAKLNGIPILEMFNYGINWDSSDETRLSTTTALVSNNIDRTGIVSFTRSQSAAFHPGTISLWPLPLGLMGLDLSYAHSLKVKEDAQTLFEVDNGSQIQNQTSKTIDNSRLQTEEYSGNISPLGLINVGLSQIQNDSYYNRNRTAEGSVLNGTLTRALSTSYSPFNLFSLAVNANYIREEQVSDPTIDVSAETLQAVRSNVINKTSYIARPTLSASPFTFISLSLGYDYLRTLQSQVSENVTVTNNTIQTDGIVAGATLLPANLIFLAPFKDLIASFQAGYSLTFKTVKANEISVGNGTTGVLTVAYNPPLIPGANISLSYSQTDNRGVGLNTLEQLASQQSANEILVTEVKSVNDTTQLGTASININIPVQSNVVSSIVITGQWNKKVVIDRTNEGNSYSIDALIFSGRVNF